MNTAKVLYALPLLWAATLVRAEDPPPVDAVDTLQLPQTLADQTKAILKEHEAEMKRLSDADVEALANDPELQQRLDDETESFARQRQTADEAFDQ